MKTKQVKPYMEDLPNVWLDYKYPPFTNTAVDYLGPILIKQFQSRLKRWGSLFACMVTRAIPLEQAGTMDTNSFINALQRFISRTGKPNTIMSDYGSNFKGAVKELKLEHNSLNQMKITEFTERQHIIWKFNPPSSSHIHKWFMGKIGVCGKEISVQHCQRQNTDRFSDDYILSLLRWRIW